MGHVSRQRVVRNMLWGYDSDALSLDELVELVRGFHGPEAQALFVQTVTDGIAPRESERVASFASLCIRFGRWDALERMADAAVDGAVLSGGQVLTPSAWLDLLATRNTPDGKRITFTLFDLSAQQGSTQARAILTFALKYQPEHPGIAELLDRGGPVAAVLTETLMQRRLAPSGEPVRMAPMAPRRRLSL
jgi:hypothetical protein